MSKRFGLALAVGIALVALFISMSGSPTGPVTPVVAPAASTTPTTAPATRPATPAPTEAASTAKIGIMTGTVSQGEEEYRAAVEMVEKFGSDRVIHVTYPDRFMDEQETTISLIVSMAADPDVRAIVICQAIPGTAAAINKARELRDDILFVLGNVHEEPFMMAGVADILFEIDQITRGRTIVEKAVALGAETFVHVSFPRHMAMPLLAARREAMEATAKELGIPFVFVNAPDPTGEGGVAGAQMFVREDVPRQVEEHGRNTAFFSTNCSMMEPLISSVMSTGAIFPEQCCPSPYHALPGALGISVPPEMAGNVPFIINAISEKVHAGGMDGRISTWTAPIMMSFIRAGSAYAMAFAEGQFTEKKDIARATAMLREVAGDIMVRPFDPDRAPNYLMVTGESIVFGQN